MITCTNLTKRFGTVLALDQVDFEIGDGTVGLLGPNGAGKTTLMRIVTTLIPPTDGEAWVDDVPINERRAVRERVGYLPQDVSFYPQLTATETLQYFAALSQITLAASESAEHLERVGLADVSSRRVGGFSGGMRQRLGIATALIGDPPVLILDEPTAGLDPEARVEFRSLLASLTNQQTVLLSTHNVHDVEATSQRVIVLDEGRKLWTGPPAELSGIAEGATWETTVPVTQLDAFRARHPVTRVVRRTDQAQVRFLGEEPAVEAESVSPSVEDGYMLLLHRAHREEGRAAAGGD